MKILLLSPFYSYKTKSEPLLGLAYIASSLEKEKHIVKIVDFSPLSNPRKYLEEEIKTFKPNICGVYSITETIFESIKIVKVIKEIKPDCLTVLGGPHPTFKAKETLSMSKSADVVVRGEGDVTFVELVDMFEKKGVKGFCDVKGITYRVGSKVVETMDRPLIHDLDDLPYPAYHLLPMKKYKFQDSLFGIIKLAKSRAAYCHIITSRGCPYSCCFCSSRKLWKEKVRNRSPSKVIKEIKFLREIHNIRVICFEDDTFTIDKKRTIEICKLIEKEKLDVSFICKTRPDVFDKDIAISLKKAGFSYIYFGLESGVQKILKSICKGFTIRDSEKAVNIAKRAGLKVGANFVIGVPGETKKDILKTISFARSLKLNRTSFSIIIPFPGTSIYGYAKKNNLILSDNWEKYKFNSSLIKIKGISQREIKGLFIKAYILCNLTPGRFINHLLEDFIKRGFEQNYKK